jgi:hypothetical protein
MRSMNASGAVARISRGLGGLALATVLTACGPGLSGDAWAWCKQHLAAVDAAADGLQIAKAPTAYQEPSWLPDYMTSQLNSSNALMAANPAFTGACDQAAEAKGVGDARLSWCMTDGIADVWDASIALGFMVDMQADTFAYKAIPLQKRIDDRDFVAACGAALAPVPTAS